MPDDAAAMLAGIDAHFDHVAVAGAAMEPMLALYRDLLGGRPIGGGRNLALGFRTAVLRFPGDRSIELLVAEPGSSFLDSFLRRTGGLGGLHHLTFLVPSVAQALEVLHEAGYETFGERPDDPGWAEAFVHPRDAGGVLLQIATKGAADEWGELWEPLEA